MDASEAELEIFVGRYLPAVAAIGRGAVRQLRMRLPGCDVLVYDNYQALAVGFSPDGKTGSAFLSVALYPRWVNLFFLQGARLPDPDGLLQGAGSVVRRVRLAGVGDLDQPHIRGMIDAAIAQAPVPYEAGRQGRLVIKSISAKQRPRRPA